MSRRVVAEFVGTAFLLAGIVGSGIQAELLTDDVGLQLLINVVGTAGMLVALILALGPRSGAHFNPAVTIADRYFGGLDARQAWAYVGAQVTGGVVGVMVTNLMFELPAVEISEKARDDPGFWLGESVATFGLLLMIFGVVRSGRSSVAAFAVGSFIGSAMFFTSSTAFANPAVTISRMLSDTFTGIAPASTPAFLAAELVGIAVAIAAIVHLYPRMDEFAADVIVPHDDEIEPEGRKRVGEPGSVDEDRRA